MLKPEVSSHAPLIRRVLFGLSKSQARRVRTLISAAQREAEARIGRAAQRTDEARRGLAAAQHKAQLAERRLEKARADAEAIFAQAMEEALKVLAALPDFAALEAKKTGPKAGRGGRSALSIVREVCDAGGFSMAVIKGRNMSPEARAVQGRAMRAVADAFPQMTADEIGKMFGGMSGSRVRGILSRASRRNGEGV